MKDRRLFWLVVAIGFLFYPAGVQAEEKYPSRPIELVVPMGPGGATDLSTRCYSDEFARELKVPVNVVNRAGGTGIQGATYVSKARKDGYTILASHAAPISTLPIINKKAVPYNPVKDFTPLGQFGYVASLIVVRSDSPFKTLKDLVEYARKNPGKLKSGQGGIGTASHFNQLILCAKNDINITSVPFQSGAESVTALLGGHVDMAANTLPAVAPHIKAGKLRGLSITTRKRSAELPDVPTTAEVGYPYFNFIGWYGLFAPAGVPQPVQDVLTRAFKKVVENPEVERRATKAGFEVDYKNPQEFREYVAEEIKITAKLAKDAGLIEK
jgi:tripartite-type tricarboxylate transporter receptor subunit TctC